MNVLTAVLVSVILVPVGIFILAMISSLFINSSIEKHTNNRFCRFILNATVFFLFPILRTRIHVEGTDIIPVCPFLLVSNHLSNFDPIVIMDVLRKRNIAFISKEKNMHIPFYGKIIQRCAYMSIDRNNPLKAMETIKTTSELIKNEHISFGVYPEGTRSRDGKLQNFHATVFRTAKLADCPVVVMTIRGTKDIAKNFPLRGAHVYVKFLETLDTDFVRNNLPAVISEKARSIMEADLES